jgi:hypothetical protein
MEQQEGDDEGTEDENSDEDIVAARKYERNKYISGYNTLHKAGPATPEKAPQKEEDHKELDSGDDKGNSEEEDSKASSYHPDNGEEDSSDKDSEDGGTRKDTDRPILSKSFI